MSPAPNRGPDATSRSRVALARHARRMRRQRLIYFGVVGAIVAVLVITAIVVWSGGEAAHADLQTVAAAPPALAVDDPSATAQLAWQTSDRLAIGTPQSGGTVITYSAHTVGGRDARTGRPTWKYTRSDRRVCTAIQVSGVTIGVYANHGNCDQLDAFDSGTGRRKWTRTLDMDGKPLNGTPTYQVLPYTVMLTSATTIYAIDPSGGLNRWNYYRFGCRITRALLGSSGALIAQSCGDRVRCSGVKFCATGPQLLLRDGSAGTDDSGDNRDKITWLRKGDVGTPASADGVVSTLARDGRTLNVLRGKDGSTQLTMDLGPGSAGTTALPLDTAELLSRGDKTFSIQPGHDSPVWTATTAGPPTAVATNGQALGVLNARLTAPVAGKVGDLDPVTGRLNRTFSVPAPPGAIVYPLGDGFLIGSASGIKAYR